MDGRPSSGTGSQVAFAPGWSRRTPDGPTGRIRARHGGQVRTGTGWRPQPRTSAPRVPALQFKQHWPQQGIVGRASHQCSFRNRADEHRRVALLRCPAEQGSQFRVVLAESIIYDKRRGETEGVGCIRGNLTEVLADDLAEMKTTLDKLTLGAWEKLLKKHSLLLISSFQVQGFNFHHIRDAIKKVNGEVMAKHQDEKGWSAASKFRDLFLESRPSVLAALLPSGANNGMEKPQH